jgi:hypothetical protein
MSYKEVMFVRPVNGGGARHYMVVSGERWVVSGQLHNPANLFPGKETPLPLPLNILRLNGPQTRPGRLGKQNNLLPLTVTIVTTLSRTSCRSLAAFSNDDHDDEERAVGP